MTKYYKVKVESNYNNPVHKKIVDYPKAVIVEFEKGKQGWFCGYVEQDKVFPWHRIQTSIVQDVEESNDTITVKTENSVYTFILI